MSIDLNGKERENNTRNGSKQLINNLDRAGKFFKTPGNSIATVPCKERSFALFITNFILKYGKQILLTFSLLGSR